MKTKHIFNMATAFIIFGLLIAASSPAAALDVYEVDPVHSAVSFRIKHLGISYVHGRFNNAAGTVTFDREMPGNNAVKVSVKVADIDTNNADREKHLKSPYFFDAEKYPVISFESETFKKIGADIYEVSGPLTLHGVTRPLTVRVLHVGSGQDPWGGYRSGFETTFTIKRSDFGMTGMIGSVGDDVELTVNIEGVRK